METNSHNKTNAGKASVGQQPKGEEGVSGMNVKEKEQSRSEEDEELAKK
jgi:hypothetical protein